PEGLQRHQKPRSRGRGQRHHIGTGLGGVPGLGSRHGATLPALNLCCELLCTSEPANSAWLVRAHRRRHGRIATILCTNVREDTQLPSGTPVSASDGGKRTGWPVSREESPCDWSLVVIG